MKSPAFVHVYLLARRKKHGSGRATRADAIRLGVMAQFISWGSPRWVHPILRAAFK